MIMDNDKQVLLKERIFYSSNDLKKWVNDGSSHIHIISIVKTKDALILFYYVIKKGNKKSVRFLFE